MSNWYVSESDSWYAPLQEPQSAAPSAARKTKSRGWIRGLIAVAVIVGLIIGSALLFPNGNAAKEAEKNEGGSSFGQFVIPPQEDEGDLPDDYREFFENFYTATDTSRTVINIERTELPIDFTCETAAAGEEISLQELYRSCAPSIVGISGFMNGKSGYNWGTGVVLSPDGLILTNTHVIADCDRAAVTLSDDSVYEAKLVGADSISDIAVLKIEASGLIPAVFGDSTVLEVGDRVAAIGNPLGEEFRLTLTDGIISAIERGMNYKGHSMNLPSNVVKLVNIIVREGSVTGRPSIGITVGAIPDEARERYGDKLPPSGGLYISAISEGSDAAEKGLRPGDIIMKVDGVEVSTTAEISKMKEALSVGDTMTFTIWRDGEIFDVDVALVDTNDVYG